jgi:hypothetical protein
MTAKLFESIASEFRRRGVVITSLPAEYAVNYLDGRSETQQTRETLSEALELAEEMARSVPPAVAVQKAAYRSKRRLSMQPNAVIKRRIKAHNRRLRARALKAQRESHTG